MGQEKKSYIKVNTRELDRVLVTKYLSYIYLAYGLCYTNLAYSKGIYILYIYISWYYCFRTFYNVLYDT